MVAGSSDADVQMYCPRTMECSTSGIFTGTAVLLVRA